ncbi:helix-turn-helix transcriptional regulator [Paenibacillus sp. SYP-B4298]|uniref:helix-turn-helix transcriptional regulator n=1 Tax=Paenibacillus sp. SYP-B4298 TaxID=2996034 RepID=UPI0022DD4B4B|nr:winged helix-turn-helix transcriptional regulator [Paenibacillus sp. SYP-B4298]
MDNRPVAQTNTELQGQGGGATRHAVLMLFKTKGPSPVADLAKSLGITEMAVRRHLGALERDGYITSSVVRQPMGRPAHIYSLTELGEGLFPKNYAALTLDLLEELEDEQGMEGTVSRLFAGRKKKLQDRYEPFMSGKELDERVQELAAIQNAGGYMVQIDASSNEEYVLHEYNCPIAVVAGRYEQACSCELELFEALLEAPVRRTECLAKGGSKCTYRIAKTT